MELTEEQKRILEQARARRMAATGPASTQTRTAPEEPDPELGLIDSIRGGLQSFQRGQLFGLGDEIVGAGRALTDYGIAALLGEDLGDQTFGERYRMYRDDERQNQERFANKNGGLALALELGGAIAAPIKGPRGAREAVPLPKNKVARNLVKAAEKVAPQGGYRALAGRGAAEGALYGVGTADELSDIPDAVAREALIGGAFGAGFRGLQGAGQQLAKRRVAEDLGRGDKQMPIWLAQKKSKLGEFYRNFLGRSFFARTAMQAQEEPFMADAADAVWRTTQNRQIKGAALDEAAQAIKDNLDETKKLIAGETRRRKRRVSSERRKLLEETQQVLDDDVRNLRATAAQEAFPDNHRVERLEGVDLDNPIEVSKALDDFWKNDAFQMVKQREFDWDTSLPKRLKEQFASDPDLILEMGDEPELIEVLAQRFGIDNASVEDVLSRLREWAGEKGLSRGDELFLNPKVQIDGEALMAMRNFFARRANKGGDKSRGYFAIKDRFDEMIKRQLDDEAKAAFEDQINRYVINLTYRDATRAADATGGRWMPDQWLKAGKNYGDYSLEKVPLQRQADTVLERSREAEALSAADKARRSNRVTRLGDAQKAAEYRAKRLAKAELKDLDVKGQKQRLDDAKTKAVDAEKVLKSRKIPEDPSGPSEWIMTRLLADALVPSAAMLALGPAGLPVGLAAAAGASKGLTSRAGQRAMAGQTQWQNAMRNMSDDEKMRFIARLLRQGATRTATLQTVD